jgi:hypothetical protein
VEKDRIVKGSKDAKGLVTRKVLTRHWTDWIDYWAGFQYREEDFISFTDIARRRDSELRDCIILNWLRTWNGIEFLGIWEELNNSDFNSIEIDGIRSQEKLEA